MSEEACDEFDGSWWWNLDGEGAVQGVFNGAAEGLERSRYPDLCARNELRGLCRKADLVTRRLRLPGWSRATLSLLLVALSCSARVESIDLEAVQRDLQTICKAENAALSQRNFDAAYASYAPDWVVLDMDGTRLALTDERRLTQELFQHLTAFRGVTTVERVRALGDDVLAFAQSEVEMDLLDAKTRRSTTLRYLMTAEVLWRHSGKRWLAYRTRILSRKRWVDGVLVSFQTRPAAESARWSLLAHGGRVTRRLVCQLAGPWRFAQGVWM